MLSTESRLPDPDAAYRALIEAHRGLDDDESAALNTRLVLILANHIGDEAVLREAIALAKAALPIHPGEGFRGTLAAGARLSDSTGTAP